MLIKTTLSASLIFSGTNISINNPEIFYFENDYTYEANEYLDKIKQYDPNNWNSILYEALKKELMEETKK